MSFLAEKPPVMDAGFSLTEIRPESTLSDTTRNEKPRLMLLPILFRSPETGFALGVLPQLIYRSVSSSNPSTLRLDSYYTQNNQYQILLRTNNWIQDDRLQITARVSIKKWPTSFYGIGNNTPTYLKETFTESLYEAEGAVRRRIWTNFFIGMGGSVRFARISSIDPDGILAEGAVHGSSNTFIAGIDAGVSYDTRDNHFFPSSGSLHRLTLYLSPAFAGSDYTFTRASIDFREYIALHKSQVLALRAYGAFSWGDVPFRLMPSAGRSLRGYPAPRFIDQHSVSAQLEYRIVPLFWRIGVVFFAGVGDVFNRFSDINGQTLKYMTGFGLRYVIFRDERINIRFDVSIGRNSFGDYIDLTEAF